MIKRELSIFLVVGVTTVLIDYAVYQALLWWAHPSVNTAKAVGFLAGTLFSYAANRLWTFAANRPGRGSAWRFAGLYALTLGANVVLNHAALSALASVSEARQIAFVLATGVSAVLNFLGMKLFVFKTLHHDPHRA